MSERRRVEGEWRCAQCGHGDDLTACATAVVWGRLQPDGTVTPDYDEQDELLDASIQCKLHHDGPDFILERWFDVGWTRWVPCTHTEYDRRRDGIRYPNDGPEYHCDDGTWKYYSRAVGECPACHGRGGRWVVPAPAAEAGQAAAAAPVAAEVDRATT